MATPQLIIIPGLGDMHWVYRLAALGFRLRGYRVRIHVVGWDDTEESYPAKLQALCDDIRASAQPVTLLGVSAGGVMAVNALAVEDRHVSRVVTLCAPYRYRYDHEGELIAAAQKDLVGLLPSLKPRFGDVTSFHALFDTRVRPHDSQPIGITHHALPSVFHRVTIFLGLTIFSGRLHGALTGKIPSA